MVLKQENKKKTVDIGNDIQSKPDRRKDPTISICQITSRSQDHRNDRGFQVIHQDTKVQSYGIHEGQQLGKVQKIIFIF